MALNSRQVTTGSKYLSGYLSALLVYTLQLIFYISMMQSDSHTLYKTGRGITCAVDTSSLQSL